MKRKSIISLGLVGATLLSMYGTALANTTSGVYDFGGTSGYFMWTWIDGIKTLQFTKPDYTWGSPTSFEDYKDSAKKIVITDASSYSSYSFGGVPFKMDNVYSLTAEYNCSSISGISNFENLEDIYIEKNQCEIIYLDLSETDYDTLPDIHLVNSRSDLKVDADYTGFDNTFVTIPASYGIESNHIYYDFDGSTALESVTFEEGTEVIRCYAFEDCTDLEGVNIPDGVTLIEYEAFNGCESLTSIDIPASVTEIKYDAFIDSGLTDIYYDGTTADWYGLVTILDSQGQFIGNVLELDGVTVHCTNGNMYIREDEDGENRQAPIGWFKEDSHWRYYWENGAYSSNNYFEEIDGNTYFFDNNGYMATGWKQIGGNWYFFGSNGVMRTGWAKAGKTWYYFNSDGIMQTGWQKIGNKWYYLGTDGAMKTGWQKISNKWYYFNGSGVMQTGWQQITNKWYYFASGGAMYSSQWLKSGGKWYYFGSDGVMLSNTSQKIGNKTYNFNSSGVCTNP